MLSKLIQVQMNIQIDFSLEKSSRGCNDKINFSHHISLPPPSMKIHFSYILKCTWCNNDKFLNWEKGLSSNFYLFL